MKTKTPEWIKRYRRLISMLVCRQKCFALPSERHLGSLFYDTHLEKASSFIIIKGADSLSFTRRVELNKGFLETNQINHQASWLPTLKSQNCCFRGRTGLRKATRNGIPQEKSKSVQGQVQSCGGFGLETPSYVSQSIWAVNSDWQKPEHKGQRGKKTAQAPR